MATVCRIDQMMYISKSHVNRLFLMVIQHHVLNEIITVV